tara:strand:- start:4299 stop:4670 length:372 start_codon:yes stop_codon:yes gene_type:complete
MSQETPNKEQQLFMYLVGTFQSSAWIALGKMKNPMTDKIEPNLEQASFYIDLLDLMQMKMKGNMSEYEEQMLINTVSELKMNFIEEQKKIGESDDEKIDNSEKSDPEKKKKYPKTKPEKKSNT